MTVRTPAVAGTFYPGSRDECRSAVDQFFSAARESTGRPSDAHVGGVVPHAGWVYSGGVAADVIRAVAGTSEIETFVVFGAMHRAASRNAVVYPEGYWETPLGEIAIDSELATAIVDATDGLTIDAEGHRFEHSIEVQVPFIQRLAPGARLLPILVPPTASAHEVGRVVAERAAALQRRVVFLGSTDLTHYGPSYRFTPKGHGPAGLKWAKEVNDRKLLDLIVDLKADQVVPEATANHNACGSGAIAAALRASQTSGADHASILQHITSNEVAFGRLDAREDAVGYAGIVFSKPQ